MMGYNFVTKFQLSQIAELTVFHRGFSRVVRNVYKVLDDEGKPFYPEPVVKSQLKPPAHLTEIKKKKFNPKVYQNYLATLSLKDSIKCSFIKGLVYSKIDQQHHDFLEAKLIVRGISRERKDAIILEGKRLINDAIKCGMTAEKIFFTDVSILESLHETEKLIYERTRFYLITEKNMRKLSDVENPPGIIGLFNRQLETESLTRSTSIPLFIIGDNIRDPGNMGSLIRSAAAVGAERVLCAKGCVDPWNSKVVRSGCGSHFRVNILENFDWSAINNFLPVHESTILFAKKLSEDSQDRPANIVPRLRRVNYYELDYRPFLEKRNLGIVIGGETHGVSEDAYKFTKSYEKIQISIPLMKGVESLNSAVAASVILFEIQRQILKK